ncbi:MAG: hypothetical protein FJY76_03515 [Candidatus Aenigmarchaeota archaeon]|nr:hypothetical protein [Candidatus Aenigmarchaeota archaeon]
MVGCRRSNRSRKGAFDLSVSFIIVIVIAVVLLTLGITWLRGIIGGITGLTDDLTQQASSKLQDTFQQTTQNFGIYPSRWEMTPGKNLKMSAGIKNNAADGNTHQYVVNVIPTAVSSDILRNKCAGSSDIETCTVSINYQGETLAQFMKSWVTLSMNGPFSVEATRTVFNYITVSVPSNAPLGTYMFGVMACKVDGTGMTQSQCIPTATTGVWGGGVQPLEILIKPS